MDLRIICISTFLLLAHTSFGQNEPESAEKKRSRVMIAIGHTIVGQGINDQGKRSWLSLPSWMIDYDYSLSKKWTIGLHNDLITESFKVEGYFLHEETTEIERSFPVASVVATTFKPGKHAVYSLGVGGEFSSTGNYFMTRLGFEYEFELPGEWELAPTITYDIKWNAYDSFNVGLGIGKRF